MINNFIIESRKKDGYSIAEEIVKSTGLYSLLYNDKSPEGITRFENIQELLNAIKNFSDNAENNYASVSFPRSQYSNEADDSDDTTETHDSEGDDFSFIT